MSELPKIREVLAKCWVYGLAIFLNFSVTLCIFPAIGKKHALKRYDQFALNTSCFWGSTESNITPVVQFHEIFVTKILNILLLNQKFGEIAHL